MDSIVVVEGQAVEVQAAPVTITLPVGLTPIGLALPDDLSKSAWQEIGKQLAISEAIQWALGDWYLWGRKKWGKKAAEKLAAETGYSKYTLYAYGEVAEQIEFCRRLQNLSFSHHRVVVLANLESKDQDEYLRTAAVRGDSVSDLEQRIKNDREEGNTKPSEAEQAATASTEPTEAEQPAKPKALKTSITFSERERQAFEALSASMGSNLAPIYHKPSYMVEGLVIFALCRLGYIPEIKEKYDSKLAFWLVQRDQAAIQNEIERRVIEARESATAPEAPPLPAPAEAEALLGAASLPLAESTTDEMSVEEYNKVMAAAAEYDVPQEALSE